MNQNIIEQKFLNNQIPYGIYAPEQINKHTSILVYEADRGGGGYNGDSKYLISDLNTNGSNYISLFYNRDIYNEEYLNPIDLINHVSTKYNVPAENYVGVGIGKGAPTTITTMASIINQNPNIPQKSLMILDGDFIVKNYEQVDQAAQTLGNAGTVAFIVNSTSASDESQTYNKWSEYGMNVLLITDLNAENTDDLNENFVKNNLANFITGSGSFPSESYFVQTLDKDNNELVTIDISNMSLDEVLGELGIDIITPKFERLSSLQYIQSSSSIISDSDLLTIKLNNIIGAIKSSSFLTTYNPNLSFSSTTKIPSEIPTLVKSYINIKTILLEKIANDMYEFAKIGESIDIMDQTLFKNTSNLGGNFNINSLSNKPNFFNKYENLKPFNYMFNINGLVDSFSIYEGQEGALNRIGFHENLTDYYNKDGDKNFGIMYANILLNEIVNNCSPRERAVNSALLPLQLGADVGKRISYEHQGTTLFGSTAETRNQVQLKDILSGADCNAYVGYSVFFGSKEVDPWIPVSEYQNLGKKIEYENFSSAQPGDICATNGHVMLIVGVDVENEKYLVAHASGETEGILTEEMSFDQIKSQGFQVRDLTEIYGE